MSATARYALAAALAVAGLLTMGGNDAPPPPQPLPDGAFSLRGKFIGPTASADAASLAALCDELADCIQHDGASAEPRLKTGVAFDDLRVAAREARMRGESIGARQPHARDAIQHYLEAQLGTSGGPVTPEGRDKWVKAYRDVGRAAADAAR